MNPRSVWRGGRGGEASEVGAGVSTRGAGGGKRFPGMNRAKLARANPDEVPGENPASQNGRGGEIRTRDLYVPNVALYQAKLRPDLDTSQSQELVRKSRRSESDEGGEGR